MSSAAEIRLTPRLIIGLAIMALGVLFTLDNLDVLDAELYTRFWPLALVAVGLLKLLQGAGGSRLVGGLLALAGTWLLLRNLGVVPYDLGDLWPLILVMVGLGLIFGGAWRRGEARRADATSGEVVRNFALLGRVTVANSCQRLRGGDVAAVMGGLELDLRRAATAGEGAVVDAFAFWGGVDVWVPEGWSVTTKVVPFMGGYEDKTRPPRGETDQHLLIKGFAIMGGIEVSHGPSVVAQDSQSV